MAASLDLARPSPATKRARYASSFLDSTHLLSVFIAGTLAFLLCFVLYPIVYNLLMSFQQVSVGNLGRIARPWAGLDNYAKVLGDPVFGVVLWNSIVFTSVCVVMQVTLGFLLALLFAEDFPGAGFFRGVILAGWITPLLVVGAIFRWMYATNGGLINEALVATGLVAQPLNWLSSTELALPAIIIANIWYGAPFAMILLSAGLANLPRELYEAAHLDGAGPLGRLRWITLPLMRPTILAVLTLCTIYTLRAFDLLWSMTGGGPVNSSTTLPLWSYIFSFKQFDFGAGAAVATLMFTVVILAGLLYIRSLRSEVRL